MKLRINGLTTHDSSTYLKVMSYIDEVIKEHSIYGNFNFINLYDTDVGRKCELTRFTSWGVLTMSKNFFSVIKNLCSLGILNQTNSYETLREANKYCIDKNLFLVFYSLLLAIHSLTPKQILLLGKKDFGNHLVEIILGIEESTHQEGDKIYSNKQFNTLVKKTYYYLFFLCNATISKELINIGKLNHYVKYFTSNSIKENIYNLINQPNQPTSLPYQYNNISPLILPFYKDLGISWFTNCCLNKRRKDSKQLEKYFEKYLSKNKQFSPIISILENKFNKIEMHDIDIDKDIFMKLPGLTISKKKEVLCELVKYWIIKNCPILNYTLGLIDDLKYLNDDYRINSHIILIENSNQYGVYSYTIHFSGRMTNDFCKVRKARHCGSFEESREYILGKEGFDSELDLHSSIFSITRSLNYGIPLDLSFDIKHELEKLKIRGTIDGVRRQLVAKDYKGLLFYMYFSKNLKEAYENYKNRFNAKWHKIFNQCEDDISEEEMNDVVEQYTIEKEKIMKYVAQVSERDFNRIYHYIHYCVGETNKYTNNIFVIESAIMARTIVDLYLKGCSTKNVYDCIWWRSEEISREEVQSILIKCAQKVFDKYNSFFTKNREVRITQILPLLNNEEITTKSC